MPPSPKSCIDILIDYDDPYVQPLVLSSLQSRLLPNSYRIITSLSQHLQSACQLLQWCSYESLDFDLALSDTTQNLMNSYVIRKALIRKHYLSTTISNWITKNPGSILKHHFKPAVAFELDYAEFLDDALTEADAFDLRGSLEANLERDEKEREWWILKPGMSDRGQGIKLFSTEEQLVSIFEEWEAENPDSDDNDDDNVTNTGDGKRKSLDQTETQTDSEDRKNGPIITSHLRHFIAQPYIHPPLLFPSSTFPHLASHKFHLRAYVLAVGALKVYLYRPVLALFAPAAYTAPHSLPDPNHALDAHLTNTCLQQDNSAARAAGVKLFWELPTVLPELDLDTSWKENVFEQMSAALAETFEAAARGMSVHFQPLPGAFELFGVDFLVDARGQAWLLEVNAFPDFGQTGEALKALVAGLFEEVVDVAVKPFFGIEGKEENGKAEKRMKKVLDIDLGRR